MVKIHFLPRVQPDKKIKTLCGIECRPDLFGRGWANTRAGSQIDITDVQERATCKTCLSMRALPLSDEDKRSRNATRCRQYRAQNLETMRAATRECMRRVRAKRPGKSRAEYRRRYRANPEKFIARVYERRRLINQRTPPWVDKRELQQVYDRCPEGMHVDHIVPLAGITADGYGVTGLHVPWNLQILTPSENSLKGSRMRPEDRERAQNENT